MKIIPHFLIAFAPAFGQRKALLRCWGLMNMAKTTLEEIDYSLPKIYRFSKVMNVIWSALHVLTFSPMIFVMGSILLVPAVFIHVWWLFQWINKG